MRVPGDGDDAVRLLIEEGSSSWAGPSPLAAQSRWAGQVARRRRLAGVTRMVAAGGMAMLLGLAVVVVWAAPGGAVGSVMHLVAQAFPGLSATPNSTPGSNAWSLTSPSPSPGAAPSPMGPIREPKPAPGLRVTPPSRGGPTHPSPAPSPTDE